MGPRACEGQLPGGSGNGRPILAHSGKPVTLQLSARQPGQPKVLVLSPHLRCGAGVQGFSELFGWQEASPMGMQRACSAVPSRPCR